MRYMSSTEIREMWYNYFQSNNHKRLDSFPLVPINDDSLLWINAGVTPLKKYFDGSMIPESRRLCSVQKCIRTNDIENVGKTARHQTFFEMMGNFSVGDYFKKEAINYSFNLLTGKEWFAIPKEKLYVTVYTNDKEAYDLWVSVGFIEDHIVKLDGNFWEIGNGPCGPDSEIFFDRGEKFDPNNDALEKFKNDLDQDRYVEIWNNVFSQFNSEEGKNREDYKELPSKNIDTGAGLERWACILQGVDSNFDTDLFKPIINKISEIANIEYKGQLEFKVIADHVRAITMALSDGASFSNTGRGYVLRRLLRRSVRMGKKLKINDSFLYKLVEVIVDIMKYSYPELINNRHLVETQILEEENLFHNTLESGEKKLLELIDKNKEIKTIDAKDVFKLYDTYGFPYELTKEYLDEVNYTTSKEDFDNYMKEQKLIAKKSHINNSNMNIQNEVLLNFKEKTEFVYNSYKEKGKVIFLFDGEKEIDEIVDNGYVILDKTCFYAESGGQISDTGMLIAPTFKARVLDVKKTPNKQNLLKVKLLDGKIEKNVSVRSEVDESRRRKIEVNHSSVHLLQYALRKIISDTIKQAGSYVSDEYLRFDFTYTGKLLDNKIIEVEDYINEYIKNNIDSNTTIMDINKAKEQGAMALFSEKYSDKVRVVTIGESKELCGGTHIKNTSEIKKLAIYLVKSIGSNIYRIEAATNDRIEETLLKSIKSYNDEKIKLLMKAKNIIRDAHNQGIELEFNVDIKTNPPLSYKDIIFEKNELEYTQEEVKNLEKKYKEAKEKIENDNLSKYLDNVKEYDNYKYLVIKVENKDNDIVKSLIDNLFNQINNGFVLIVNVKENNINYFLKSNNINSKDLLTKVLTKLNGKGGGSNTFSQGSSPKQDNLDEVLNNITGIINE